MGSQAIPVFLVTHGTLGQAPSHDPSEVSPEPALQPFPGVTMLQLSPGEGGLCVMATLGQNPMACG